MTSPIDINEIEASNCREVVYRGMASKKNLIGLEVSPQQKDTGMTSPVDINGIEASNSREVPGLQAWPLNRTSLD